LQPPGCQGQRGRLSDKDRAVWNAVGVASAGFAEKRRPYPQTDKTGDILGGYQAIERMAAPGAAITLPMGGAPAEFLAQMVQEPDVPQHA